MRIAVLTSSRADYSIYYPLLKLLKEDSFFKLNIIAFGTHLSKEFGYTVQQIVNDGFEVDDQVETIAGFSSPKDISISMGNTIQKFSEYWEQKKFDWIIALGDRYEMFAAVCASVPFGLKIAHIHGGETTLGAIDNVFRHSITLMSKLHFTAAAPYKKKVIEILGSDEKVYDVGALAMDNFCSLNLYTRAQFKEIFDINIDDPYILITIHPETVSFEKNEAYIDVFIEVLQQIKGYNLLITMPNADTMGNILRHKLLEFASQSTSVFCVESLGTIGYLSAMKHCSFLMGNSSSGYIEAGFFPKYVINVGERQKGRIVTNNIINCKFDKSEILKAVEVASAGKAMDPTNVYGHGNTASRITQILKQN